MTLSPGARVGPYEVIGIIGAGGMGEVYRARDKRLNRDVAIKILPAIYATDSGRRARLDREAQLLGALNHPNIAAIYGIEEARDLRALVLELVDGATLADRIRAGPLSIADTCAIARQIADALDAAHERGIVHRDLSPANIKITVDGVVKILDFGLAKAMTDEASHTAASKVPTITSAGSRDGLILGTAAYMSPEQARGKLTDKRTDIWAFGCILYEMLTGRPPFDGDTVSDVIASIINREPDWQSLPAQVSPELDRVLRRCLEKDFRKRIRDIADAAFDLNESSARHDAMGPAERRHLGPIIMMVSGGVALVASIVLAWVALRSSTASITRFQQLSWEGGPKAFPSLSPDGKWFVYVSRSAGNDDIYLQSVGGMVSINLTKDSAADDTQPAFSPDGEFIAFRSERSGGGIFVMGRTGESVRRVTDTGFNPSWSPDGREIVYGTETIQDPIGRLKISELWITNVATGARRRVFSGDGVQPHWSRQGHRIAYWAAFSSGGRRDVWTIAAAGGEPVRVTNDDAIDWNPVWSSDDRYLYFCSDRGGTMNVWRVPLDERTGHVEGSPESLAAPTAYAMHLSPAASGTDIAYVGAQFDANVLRYEFDASNERVTGQPVELTIGSRSWWWAEPSPDGTRLALTTRGSLEDLFVANIDGGDIRQLTSDTAKDRGPAWSPDGRQIVFYSGREGPYELWIINADGSGLHKVRTPFRENYFPVWSPVSRTQVAVTDLRGHTALVNIEDGTVVDTLPLFSVDGHAQTFVPYAWSPLGDTLAGYVSVNAGIVLYTAKSRSYRKLTDSGGFPRWLHDNRRLVFTRGVHEIDMVDTVSGTIKTLVRVQRTYSSPNLFVSVSSDDRYLYSAPLNSRSDVWIATTR